MCTTLALVDWQPKPMASLVVSCPGFCKACVARGSTGLGCLNDVSPNRAQHRTTGCKSRCQEAYQSKPSTNKDATTISTAVYFLADVLSLMAFFNCTFPFSMFTVCATACKPGCGLNQVLSLQVWQHRGCGQCQQVTIGMLQVEKHQAD